MGVEDWRINEVVVSVGGDPNIRFVELYVPPTPAADNCFFSTTQLELLNAAGEQVGSVVPYPSEIRCFPGNTYFIFATAEASEHFGRSRDKPLTFEIPPGAAQICLKSSAIRYDCVRWGSISNKIHDLNGPSDNSSAMPPPDGSALARRFDTNVISFDFRLQAPTMRQPNDGTTWIPPDAGPPIDADVRPDADTTDAPPRPDGSFPGPDARIGEPPWYSADPGGGPAISCGVGSAGGVPFDLSPALMALVPLAYLFLVRVRRL